MSRLLWSWFGEAPEPGGALVALEWAWRGPWPLWAVALPVAAALALAGWQVWRESQRRGWPVASGLLALRAALFAMLALILAQPALVGTLHDPRKPTLALLLDTSRSMQLRLDGEDQTQQGLSRWQALTDELPTLIAALDEEWDVRPIGFDDAVELLDDVEALATREPDGVGTDLARGMREAATLLRDRDLTAVLALTDGRVNLGANPLDEARLLRGRGIEVHTVCLGDDEVRNLRLLPILSQRYVFQDDPVTFPVRVAASMFEGHTAQVTLQVDGVVVDQTDVTFERRLDEQVVSLEYTADQPGRRVCVFEVAAQPGEALYEDNTQVHLLDVLENPMRVLLVEGEPRWEFRYLHTALDRDHRVELETMLLVADPSGMAAGPGWRHVFPESLEELREYDLVMVGDLPPGALSQANLEHLRDFVIEDGGGVIFLAGERNLLPFDDTPAEVLLPVRLDRHRGQATQGPRQSFRPRRTHWGQTHPILALFDDRQGWTDPWDDLPGLWWAAPVLNVRAGATVLLEHPRRNNNDGPEPLCVFQHVGRGRTLYVGFDETWRWRSRYGSRFFYRFWGQAVQYLAMPHLLGRRDLVQFELPAVAVAGDPVTVHARVMDQAGTPSQAEAHTLMVRQVGEEDEILQLHPVGDQAGLYRGELTPTAGGTVEMWLQGREDDGGEELRVIDAPLELRDPNANPTLLRRMAALGGGDFHMWDEIAQVPQRLTAPERVFERVVETPLWNRPWLLLLITGLLSVEWVARKLARLM